jgi:predicted SAM-dependent methyltransferase
MKLHLGCGQRYLDGYVNIDLPAEAHTVQLESVADRHADLLGLTYPEGSIVEIRLHHVFEHFARHTACALVASWQSWLTQGGQLRIEVPDLVRTGLVACNPMLSARRRCVAERHLFGSHEADWASHKEAYSSGQLRNLVQSFGFVIDRIDRNSWRGTYNLELFGTKRHAMDRAACERSARTYLGEFLLDDSPGELRLVDTWMSLYSGQVERTWAHAG